MVMVMVMVMVVVIVMVSGDCDGNSDGGSGGGGGGDGDGDGMMGARSVKTNLISAKPKYRESGRKNFFRIQVKVKVLCVIFMRNRTFPLPSPSPSPSQSAITSQPYLRYSSTIRSEVIQRHRAEQRFNVTHTNGESFGNNQ